MADLPQFICEVGPKWQYAPVSAAIKQLRVSGELPDKNQPLGAFDAPASPAACAEYCHARPCAYGAVPCVRDLPCSGSDEPGRVFGALRLVLMLDLVYVLAVAALVAQRVARMIASRRAQSVGSRLHLRLTGAFALLALVPTVTVAVFAGLTVNIGLEGWFSERVSRVVGNSVLAAQAYEQEHVRDLTTDAEALANFLDRSRQSAFFLSEGDIRVLLSRGQSQIQRGLKEAYVIDGTGEIRARGDNSYLFHFERPTQEQIEAAIANETLVIRDWDTNELRALVRLDAFVDRLLYVSREVDGSIFRSLMRRGKRPSSIRS